MMKTLELMKHGDRSLVVMIGEDGAARQYVVCYDYDVNGKENSQWSSGQYFTKLERAMNYWNERELHRPTYDRLSELATLFKDALLEDDAESANEYFIETCEMDDMELEYFGLDGNNDD